MALLVDVATPSRDSGGNEEQPELPRSSELSADPLKGLCFLTYLGWDLFCCGVGHSHGAKVWRRICTEETLCGDLGTSV